MNVSNTTHDKVYQTKLGHFARLPAEILDQIMCTHAGDRPAGLALAGASRPLRQRAWEALATQALCDVAQTHKLWCNKSRSQPLAQHAWHRDALKVRNLVQMARGDAGLPKSRLAVHDEMHQSIHATYLLGVWPLPTLPTEPDDYLCRQWLDLLQGDATTGRAASKLNQGEPRAPYAARMARLTPAIASLRDMGPRALLHVLLPWAHKEEVRHEGCGRNALYRILDAYVFGRSALRLSFFNLKTTPPGIACVQSIVKLDLSHNRIRDNNNPRQEPQELIGQLHKLQTVRYGDPVGPGLWITFRVPPRTPGMLGWVKFHYQYYHLILE